MTSQVRNLRCRSIAIVSVQTCLLFIAPCLTHMQCNVSLCNGDSGRPSSRRGKNFNVGYISLNIRGRLLIFGIHIDHMDLYPPDL